MRSRIFFKLLAVFVLVIAAAMVTLDFSVRSAWEKSLRQEIERNLTQKTVLFAHRVDNDRSHSLSEIAAQEALAAGARSSIIDPTGKVLVWPFVADRQGGLVDLTVSFWPGAGPS